MKQRRKRPDLLLMLTMVKALNGGNGKIFKIAVTNVRRPQCLVVNKGHADMRG